MGTILDTYHSKEVHDGSSAGIEQPVFLCGSAEDVVRSNACLTSIETLSPHDPSPGNLKVGIICYNDRATHICVCVCVFVLYGMVSCVDTL